jgi:hypothetical protein
VIHPKRNDTHPGGAVEGVDLKTGRKQLLDLFRGNRPVGEEQVAPTLAQPPRVAWKRIGPVGGAFENRVEIRVSDKALSEDCPAGRAPCAGSGHFVTFNLV